jgi:Tfp pilus assembly protein PilF
MTPKVSWFVALLSLVPLQAQYAGTVSVRQLRTKLAPRVERLVSASSQALTNGNLEKGIALLESAAKSDPSSAEIHHDLGVLYLQSGAAEKARCAFQKSLESHPHWTPALTGMSLSLYSLGDVRGAEFAARRAVDVEPRRRQAQLALGLALVSQGKHTPEALTQLRSAASEFPEARMFAAEVLLHQGALDEARDEIAAYLKSGHPDLRAQAEQWLHLVTLD